MTRVVVVRHGETDWNRNGRMQGWAPIPLNDTGREQAAAAGRWLADEYRFDRVYSSDLLRCRETVETILDACETDCQPVFERDWRERGLGVYQGLTYDDIGKRFPEFSLGEEAVEAARTTPEGGESILQVADRVTDRFERLLADATGDETALVVSHGGPIHLLLGYVKGLSLEEAVLSHRQDNCAVNEFVATDAAIRIDRENDTTWA